MSGIFAGIFGRSVIEAKRSTGYEVYVEAKAANREAAGQSIGTPTTAMKLSAVFACVRILGETMGELPLILYQQNGESRSRATNHYLYKLLHDRPNPLMTAFEFRETVQGHLALWGNAYIQLDYDVRGRVQELWPLLPGRMLETKRDGNRILYHYQQPNGKMIWMSSDTIWHLRGLGGDGLNGYSVVGFARRSFESGLMADEFAYRFYKNDARPGIVLSHPGELSEGAHENLRKSWEEVHRGVEKSHKPAILEEGMTLHEVGMPLNDAQFIETRNFQIEDVARWFRMQPHKIGHMENATFSNIEHQSIEHVVDTIHPWAKRWEQSIQQTLILPRDRQKYFAKFLLDALLRGDTASRFDAYSKARQWGWLSANDIRKLENMNPFKGGDVYLVPLNMVPSPQAGQEPEPEANAANRGFMDPRNRASLIDFRDQQQQPGLQTRTAPMRLRLRGSYLGLYKDAASRVLRREVNDIRSQIKKLSVGRAMDPTKFLLWLEEFERSHADFVKRQMTPINGSYGEAIAIEALDEVGSEDEVGPEIVRFIDSYTGSYGARHTGISLDKIKQAIKSAQQNQEPAEDAILRELDTWEDGRANGIAEEESTRVNNAVAKTVFVLSGVKKLKSVAFGDSCPYCKALNGKIVEINKWFLAANEELLPEGVDEPLTTTTNIGHPPYHGGCDCMVVASFGLEEDITIQPSITPDDVIEPVLDNIEPIIGAITDG